MNQPPDNIDSLLGAFEKADEDSHSKAIAEKQEKTRGHVTTVIIWSYIILTIILTLCTIFVAAFGHTTRYEAMLELLKTVLAIYSPIVTFILGYYYATKDN